MQVREAVAVETDSVKVRELASLMAAWDIADDREDTGLMQFSGEEVAHLYFFLVAICHQTSPRGKVALNGIVNGKMRRGWDFLLHRFEGIATRDRELLVPATWEKFTSDDLEELFGEHLTAPHERAALIRDLGSTLQRRGWTSVQDIYTQARGRIAVGNPNLLDLLSLFQAYRDPVRKKSYFFLALMRNSNVWSYEDPENLGPPVDYHEVRGHLRIGTVRILDEQLERKLLTSSEVTPDEDIAIRRAVHDAIMSLSELTGVRNPVRLHYLFWNVFRTHCTREDPNCLGHRESNLPEQYRHLAFLTGHCACPFSPVCESATAWHRLCEHVIETDYY